tara:strand:+ start:64 stop:456 length:393 start_codon:yes stop_codon:yes gene_type:complete
MNALLIILALIALSGFKPKDSGAVGTKPDETGDPDKGQVTQGFYQPGHAGYRKKKMNTNKNLGDFRNLNMPPAIKAVEPHTYFVANLASTNQNRTPWQNHVFLKGSPGNDSAMMIEPYNPVNYSTENMTS